MTRIAKIFAVVACVTALTFGADVNAFTITGSPLSNAPNPLYGSNLEQNSVVNSPGAPPTNSVLFDPTGPVLDSSTPWIQNGQVAIPFICGSCFAVVQWFFTGSESGLDVTFHAPGLPGFTEGNQNNSAYAGGPPLSFEGRVQSLGATILHQGDQLSFSLLWGGGSVDNNTTQPMPTSGVANLLFAYANFSTFETTGFLTLTKTPTDWFVFALNDGGGNDNDYDDFVGLASVVIGVAEPSPTPLSGTIFLFGGGLAAFGLLGWRRNQRAAARLQ
jgi:hypothetical protein